MSRVLAILRITCSILKIIGSLLSAWAVVKWNVRKARKSFEEEMMKAGISKEDAQKISEFFVVLEGQIKSCMKAPIGLRKRYRGEY